MEVFEIINIWEQLGCVECGNDWFFRDKETKELKVIDGDSGEVFGEDVAKKYLLMNSLNHNSRYEKTLKDLKIDKNKL